MTLTFWNYKGSTGYEYPKSAYIRYNWNNIYLHTGVDKVNNTITLKKPWVIGNASSGTKMRQLAYINNYNTLTDAQVYYNNNKKI